MLNFINSQLRYDFTTCSLIEQSVSAMVYVQLLSSLDND
jgi:hypothetical protein